ncbi:MAG: hypothetical protein ACI8P0_000243 [Planctomycetaceae bacterium]|jgi:hypothetical protein
MTSEFVRIPENIKFTRVYLLAESGLSGVDGPTCLVTLLNGGVVARTGLLDHHHCSTIFLRKQMRWQKARSSD